MKPNLSFGVLNQARWPQAKDKDDCWVVAFLAAVHAVAGWEYLPTTPAFRLAAGNPDDPTKPDGGTITQTARAALVLWPALAAEMTVLDKAVGAWPKVPLALANDRPVYLFVRSSALPPEHQYGYDGLHAVTAAISDQLRLCNPLAPAHSRWKPITLEQLRLAVAAWPDPGVSGILLPNPDEALTTHPAFPAPVDCKAAHDAGYAEAKVKAGAAVAGI